MQKRPASQLTAPLRVSHHFHDIRLVRLILTLILAAAGALPLVLLTPPFQVPDEVQHFYRAFQLSDLQIAAEVQNGVSGGTLPDSLPSLVKSSVYTENGVFYPPTPAPLANSLKLASLPLNPGSRHFVAFPGSAFYSPLPYLPQALGIAFGRLFGLGALYLLYLGRLFNALTAIALLGLAVYSMPVAAELVMLVGLLPMSLYLYASISADAAVIACALLFTALSFAATARGSWKSWELPVAAVAAAVFCSVKPVYVPIVLAGLLPGLLRHGKPWLVLRTHLFLLAAAVGASAAWLLFARSFMTRLLGHGHPMLQIEFILHHPAAFLLTLAPTLDLKTNFDFYVRTIGFFGWLTVPLQPITVYLLPLVSFFIVLFFGSRASQKRSPLCALWYLALALASLVLVFTALYLMDTQVGSNAITGVQGRYFIPLLVLAAMALFELLPGPRPSTIPWPALAILTAIFALQILAMDTTIVQAFHVFH